MQPGACTVFVESLIYIVLDHVLAIFPITNLSFPLIGGREPRPATLGYLNLYCRIQFQVGGCDIYSGRVSVVDILRQNLDTVVNGTHLACCRRRLLLHRRHHPPSLCTLLPCWYRHCVGSMIDLVTNGVTRSWPITHTVLRLTRSQTSSSSSAASSCRSFARLHIYCCDGEVLLGDGIILCFLSSAMRKDCSNLFEGEDLFLSSVLNLRARQFFLQFHVNVCELLLLIAMDVSLDVDVVSLC